MIRPIAGRAKVKTVDAIHALVRRGLSSKAAMRAVDDMVQAGEATVKVPKIENLKALAYDMNTAGIHTAEIVSGLAPVDVRALREQLGMSAATFALRYKLNQRTVEGWEIGRPIDDTANNYLHAIASNPEFISGMFEQKIL